MTMEEKRRPTAMSRELEYELAAVLEQAESAVAELRQGLAEARALKEQHEEIERLEQHFAQTKVRWEEVRAFFDEALRELREQKEPGDKP